MVVLQESVPFHTTGSAESGHIAVKRDDPDIVYAGATGSSPGGPGSLMRYDHRSGQVRLITPVPAMDGSSPPAEWPARFNWTFPVLSSRHDPRVLLTAGNVVFRSTDEGGSWEPVSPDLTRNDPDRTVASGGPITGEGPSDVYCTIIALAESLQRPREIWAGSDDGRVYRTRDGGESWQEVTPGDLPEWSSVLCLEPSPHHPDRMNVPATERWTGCRSHRSTTCESDQGCTWWHATHGRSFVAVDRRATPLRRATDCTAGLIPPRPTVRTLPQVGWDLGRPAEDRGSTARSTWTAYPSSSTR